MKNKPPLILASASTNRLELLTRSGIKPDSIANANIDETRLKGESAKQLVLRLAQAKAATVAATQPNAFILAADTTISVGRRILEKPENEAEARQFLELLSGRRHRVWGGIALITPEGKCITRAICTSVAFKRLSASEITNYLASNEWQNKAGGYGIQGLAGCFVTLINGSYSNIVGISLYDTMVMLNGNGYQ